MKITDEQRVENLRKIEWQNWSGFDAKWLLDEIERLLSSEQAWRDTAHGWRGDFVRSEDNALKLQTQLNQAVKTLKNLVDSAEHIEGCPCENCETIDTARDFLSSLSQGTEEGHE